MKIRPLSVKKYLQKIKTETFYVSSLPVKGLQNENKICPAKKINARS